MNLDQAMLLLRALFVLLGITFIVFIHPMIEPIVAMLKAKKEEIEASLTAQEKEDLDNFILNAVEAAEQAMKSATGQEKKKAVMKKVAQKVSTLTKLAITTKEIDDIVEAFVYGMNSAKGK